MKSRVPLPPGVLLSILIIGVSVVLYFISKLAGADDGSAAGAIGNVIGGTIGAFGSAAAVYLTLNAQRHEESNKIEAAILYEVLELCKAPIGQLGLCGVIQNLQFSLARADVNLLFRQPTPIVYPALADNISRLSEARLIVGFYAQLEEASMIANIISEAVYSFDNPLGIRREDVPREELRTITDLLINQCLHVVEIIKAAKRALPPERLPNRELEKIEIMLKGQLDSAREIFPTSPEW